MLFMAGFLGTLEYVLEEGPQYEWMQDPSVAICAWICGISAIAFFWRVFTAAEPIVNLRTFSNRNFAIGCVLQFCIGIGLYGLTYIYPRYLAEVRGYSALMIGETMFVSGITMFLIAPVVGRLMAKYDMRYMIAFGLVVFALGSYQMTWITRDYDFYELLIPQILRGIGHDVRDGADQQHRARHAGARPGEERLGPLQPDAQSRRCRRSRRHQHRAQ
ncbi:hypothetical protein ACVWZL_005549 [Bradyrhizobium sp. GM2.4]